MEELFINKYKEILKLFNVKIEKGYDNSLINEAIQETNQIPYALKIFYEKFALSEELLNLQDELILPNRYNNLINDECLIFFNENQGLCQAGIKYSDSDNVDPPVYVSMDNGPWVLSCNKVSDFLVAMYGYMASICLEYNPEEFYFISKEENERLESLFTKRKETINWIEYEIILYGDENYRIATMNNDDYDIQMNYAANNVEDYEKIAKRLYDFGEAI